MTRVKGIVRLKLEPGYGEITLRFNVQSPLALTGSASGCRDSIAHLWKMYKGDVYYIEIDD